jgi:hypothetical protein
MRRASLLLLLAACDGQDSLGQMTVSIDGQPAAANSCMLSTAASQHRPHGLYVYAELPTATLELDIDEGGQPDPKRVIYRELDPNGAEAFRSITVSGQITLLGPPKERRGELALHFYDAAGHTRKVVGSFAPLQQPLPPPPDDNGNATADDYSQAIDTGCEAASDSSDSEGCDGSGGSDTSASGCDGSSSGSASGCDSAGSGASGCSGDAGGGCSGSAHAATIHPLGPHIRVHKASPVRILSWLFPYALVGVFIRAWRRRLIR